MDTFGIWNGLLADRLVRIQQFNRMLKPTKLLANGATSGRTFRDLGPHVGAIIRSYLAQEMAQQKAFCCYNRPSARVWATL